MHVPTPELTGLAGEIEAVIGRAATIRLIAAHRGAGARSWRVCVYVPKALDDDHKLVRMIGRDAAERLVAAFGGEILQPGHLRGMKSEWMRRTAWQLATEGWPAAWIAEVLRWTPEYARRVLNDPPPEGFAVHVPTAGSGATVHNSTQGKAPQAVGAEAD